MIQNDYMGLLWTLIVTIVGGVVVGLILGYIKKEKQEKCSSIKKNADSKRKNIVFFPSISTTNISPKKYRRVMFFVWGTMGLAIAILIILCIVSEVEKNNEREITGEISLSQTSEQSEYFISEVVSDTLDTNFQTAKKIVVTTSRDTTNVVLTGELEEEVFGPFNMTKETERRFSFVATFDKNAEYTVTITAISEQNEEVSKTIFIQNSVGIHFPLIEMESDVTSYN